MHRAPRMVEAVLDLPRFWRTVDVLGSGFSVPHIRAIERRMPPARIVEAFDEFEDGIQVPREKRHVRPHSSWLAHQRRSRRRDCAHVAGRASVRRRSLDAQDWRSGDAAADRRAPKRGWSPMGGATPRLGLRAPEQPRATQCHRRALEAPLRSRRHAGERSVFRHPGEPTARRQQARPDYRRRRGWSLA